MLLIVIVVAAYRIKALFTASKLPFYSGDDATTVSQTGDGKQCKEVSDRKEDKQRSRETNPRRTDGDTV